MNAFDAKANRKYSQEQELNNYKNITSHLVDECINLIYQKIEKVSAYTNAIVYPLHDFCNRLDVVDLIRAELHKNGYKTSFDRIYSPERIYDDRYCVLWIKW